MCKYGSTAAKGPRTQACLKSNLFVQSKSQLADFPKEVGKKGYLYLAGRDGQARSETQVPTKTIFSTWMGVWDAFQGSFSSMILNF